MKLHFIILFFVTLGVFSQNENSESEVYLLSTVDKKPDYPGGISELFNFISNNINISTNNKFEGGRIITSFIVNDDGVLSDVKIIKGLELNIDNEIFRLLNSCKNWLPGEIENKKVKVKYVLPIKLPKIEGVLPQENKDLILDTIYSEKDIDVMPVFEGGINEFYNYVGKNFEVPDIEGLQGKIFASFVLEKDGTLNDIKIVRDEVGNGCAVEFVRVLKNSPKWTPAIKKNKPVRVLYSIPINIESKSYVKSTKDLKYFNVSDLESNGIPKYPKGLEAFYSFIYNNLDSKKIKKFKKKLKIYIGILDNGTVQKVYIEDKINKDVSDEITRVLRLSEKWTPGFIYGINVNVKYDFQISIGY
jgi:hypothetical protein